VGPAPTDTVTAVAIAVVVLASMALYLAAGRGLAVSMPLSLEGRRFLLLVENTILTFSSTLRCSWCSKCLLYSWPVLSEQAILCGL